MCRYVGSASVVNALDVGPYGDSIFTANDDKCVHLWDLRSGREIRRYTGHAEGIYAVAISSDGCLLASSSSDKTIRVYDTTSAGLIRVLRHGDGLRANSIAFAPGGDLLAAILDVFYPESGEWHGVVQLWNARSGDRLKQVGSRVISVSFSPDGRYIVTGCDDFTTRIWSIQTGRQIRIFVGASAWATSVAFSRDGMYVLAGGGDFLNRDYVVRVWSVSDGHEISKYEGHTRDITSAVFSRDARLGLTASRDGTAAVWEIASGRNLLRLRGHSGEVTSARFLADEHLIATSSSDQTIIIWEANSGDSLCQLISQKDGGWIAATPDGQFDASQLDQITAIHWLMADDPLTPLSPEIFMRDYFEPRLVPRLLACDEAEAKGDDANACAKAFKPVRPLGRLNRIQPPVRITSVHRGAVADEVLVEVEVESKEDTSQPNGKIRTAAYDLRLFRDGQLVGQWPEPRDGVTTVEDDLEAWRATTRVSGTGGAGIARHTFAVRLATHDRGQSVPFTAYTFNEDRVKSETVSASYVAPLDMPERTSRAYVVTIGINDYQDPRRNLEFAVNDAESMAGALRRIKNHEVVRVSLVSDSPGAARPVDQGTKANIRAVLKLLAGEGDLVANRTVLASVAGADRLAKATPDDVVILTFSGHGYTERDGTFYLLPSDSGTEDPITDAARQRFISSEELSQWVRKLDAGEMAMIIDACHSAASVEAGGFKPGPMGDRGLGQLAYDKGMRILAASQTDDVALEVRNLRHGLLTYALEEGLQPGKEMTLAQWLKYGEERTPALYADVQAGRVVMVSRDSTVNAHFIDAAASRAQTPALFDFHRANDHVIFQA